MWILLGLLCALLTGTSSALTKKLLGRSSEGVVGWGRLLFSIPGLAAVAWTFRETSMLSGSFWPLIAVMIPLELTAYVSYLRAIRTAPISLADPFLAFTPLIAALTGWLFLGERVTAGGLAGVVIVTAGAYVLLIDRAADGILAPFHAMARIPAIRLMLLTAGLYALTSVLGKRAIALSGPTLFPFLYFSANAVAFTPIALREASTGGALLRSVRQQWPLYLLAGGITSMALLAHSFGIQRAPVAYFLSIKRLSLLVSVLYGGLWFREDSLPQRFLGAGLMLAGSVLIIVSAGW